MAIYTPPALTAVDFDLVAYTPPDLSPATQALVSYTPPALSAVDFALVAYTPPTYPYVGWELLPDVVAPSFLAAWAAGANVILIASPHP